MKNSNIDLAALAAALAPAIADILRADEPEATKAPKPTKAHKGTRKAKLSANEREARKVERRIAWHEARLSALGKSARPGQIRWNKAEIARLQESLVSLRGHAAEHGETLPPDVRDRKARKAIKRASRLPDSSVASVMAASKGDTIIAGGEEWICAGGGWFRDSEGRAARRGDIIGDVD